MFATSSIFSGLEGEIGELLRDELSGTQKNSLLRDSKTTVKVVFPTKELNHSVGPRGISLEAPGSVKFLTKA